MSFRLRIAVFVVMEKTLQSWLQEETSAQKQKNSQFNESYGRTDQSAYRLNCQYWKWV